MLQARNYQVSARNAVWNYFRNGGTGHPLVALPTGTGKAFCIADMIIDVARTTPSARQMMLTDAIELIEQNYEELKGLWPAAPVGIFSDGLDRKEHYYPITFAGIASVNGKAHLFGKIDLIYIDEAHMVSPKESTMYMKFIADLMKINPKLKVIGYTATKYRVGQGLLIEPGGLFTDIVFDGTGFDAFNWFIDQGFLVPLLAKKTTAEQDLSAVGIIAGEFNQKQLQRAANKEELNRLCVQETLIVAREEGRRYGLVFATGIEHTEAVCAEFCAQGANATFVHSKMDKNVRRQRIRDFKAGKYDYMVNNGILTKGFNMKMLDMIILMRATRSPGLLVQMLGRLTRPLYADGWDINTLDGRLQAIFQSEKRNGRVLDFAGNIKRLGPINDPRIPLPPKQKKRPGDAPVKICDECGAYNHPSYNFCGRFAKTDPKFDGLMGCGVAFEREAKFSANASEEDVIKLKTKIKVVRYEVNHVAYNVYHSMKQTVDGAMTVPSIRVTYHCEGKRNFEEFVCLEHGGAAQKRAERWWRDRTKSDVPTSVVSALREIESLIEPTHLDVWINKGNKYPEIMNYVYPSGSGPETQTRNEPATSFNL